MENTVLAIAPAPSAMPICRRPDFLDPHQMSIEWLAVTDRNPGIGFSDFSIFCGKRSVGKPLVPVMVHAERRHPPRMSVREPLVPCDFGPVVQIELRLRDHGRGSLI